jgi:RND superfamily putative drug exporter
MKVQEQDRPAAVAPHGPDADVSLQAHGLYRLGLAYGRFIYRFRWLVLALWLIGLLISIPFASTITDVLGGDGYSYSGSESAQVSALLKNNLHQGSTTQLLVVFQSTTTPVTNPAYQQEISAFMNRARSFANVSSVLPGGVGADGRTTLVVVSFQKSSSYVENQLSAFRALLPSGNTANPARVYLTGDAPASKEFSTITAHDTEYAEGAALPIALVVLLIVFGSLVAAAMPLLLALVAVPVALAVIYAIAAHTQTSIFVLNIASIIGLGISIDYSLFMTRRFRDELAQGRSSQEAVAWTVATSGEAILFSGMTVMIGFLGLLLLGIPFMTSMGLGGAVVVISAVLAALTLLPALLGVLGRRVNAVRVRVPSKFLRARPCPPVARAGAAGRDVTPRSVPARGGGFWQRWALWVMRRPVLITVVVGLLLLGMGWPVVKINVGSGDASSLPASSEARQGLDILAAQFPQASQTPIYVVARTPDGSSILTSTNLARIDHLTQWLAAQPHITSVVSLTRLPASPGAPVLSSQVLADLYSTGAYQQNPDLAQFVASTTVNDFTVITVNANTTIDSPEGKALIDQLRAGDRAAGQGLNVLVGGDQASNLDFNRYLYGKFPWAILFILGATYLLLLIMFRSVLLPLKAILMNVLSISATYGVLVLVFQWGYFSGPLGFTPNGFIDSTAPILLFCVLFGLSMDYEVFLLSRIREEWLRTQNNRGAVARGLEKTGGVITNAALLFVIVAGAFTFTSLVVTKEFGVGLTVAVVVDATIIRTLLVPATMRLLGRWNWWLPGRPLPPSQEAQPALAQPE